MQLEIGMAPSLQENACPAPGKQFFDLLADLLVGQKVTFRTGRLAIEGAEAAVDDANVGVIDIAIHQEGYNVVGMAALADSICRDSQGLQIGLLKESDTFF